MNSAIRRSAVVAAMTGGLMLGLAGVANASPAGGPLVTEDPCPAGYHGVIVGTDPTGPVYACENLV